MSRAVPSKHGEALGLALADLADSQVAANPQIRERCADCALRRGTMPNKMAPTLLEAMKCVLRVDPSHFGCHHGLDADGNSTKLCAGYLLCRAAPFERAKAAIFQVGAALNEICDTGGDMTDPAFAAWRAQHDPNDKMNDYQRAAAYRRHCAVQP
jgi:hypothetical protein